MDKIKAIPLDKLSRGFGPIDKLKFGITYLRLSRNDIKEMKCELKKEARNIIDELNEPKLKIIDAMAQYLEEYIDSLSKKDTFKLYIAYLEVQEAVGLAQEHYSKLNFLVKMYQDYRKSGWTMKKPKAVKKVVATAKTVRKSVPKKTAAKKTVASKKVKPARRKVAKTNRKATAAKKKAPTKKKATKRTVRRKK